MNAPTFDAHPSVCPACHHSSLLQSHKLLPGLLVCEHCQERLVMSRNGHYVRDPFRWRQANLTRSLRRESHPFYRILRDLQLTRSPLWVVLLAGILMVGASAVLGEKLDFSRHSIGQPDTAQTK